MAQTITFLKLQWEIKQQNTVTQVELTQSIKSVIAYSLKGVLPNINDHQKTEL